jgi:hypothetical protein
MLKSLLITIFIILFLPIFYYIATVLFMIDPLWSGGFLLGGYFLMLWACVHFILSLFAKENNDE